ncbi:hypothetical protein PG985_009469 [Apiospora marii]|uniref:uncharacterized protein n=1 Tax=Apiospora marii TaxID=335849 RepID=UPI0031310E60
MFLPHFLSLLDNSSTPDVGSVADSPPAKVVARVPPNENNDPVWPFDPPPGERPDGYQYMAYYYHCNKLAQQFNQIPWSGVTVKYRGELQPGQEAAPGETYTQAQIYATFRHIGAILYSAQRNEINLQDYQRAFGGELFPRLMGRFADVGLREVFIGLGSYQATVGRGARSGNTQIYEWPIVSNGIWPTSDPPEYPGPDRLLFQLINGLPLYLGVYTRRGYQPTPFWLDPPPSWGSVGQVNGRENLGQYETLRFPGQDPNNPLKPHGYSIGALKQKISRQKGGYWGENYGPPPPPPPPENPDPGTGAGGGGSGQYPPIIGPGGSSSSGGGTSGAQGALGGRGTVPMVGNVFRKNQPQFMAAPSHVEL